MTLEYHQMSPCIEDAGTARVLNCSTSSGHRSAKIFFPEAQNANNIKSNHL
jgi:hypothetical protein